MTLDASQRLRSHEPPPLLFDLRLGMAGECGHRYRRLHILREEFRQRLGHFRMPLRHQRVHVCTAILTPFDEHLAEKTSRELVADAGERRWKAALVAKFLHGAREEGVAGGVLEDRLALVIRSGHRGNSSTAAVAVVAGVAVEGSEHAVDGPLAVGRSSGLRRREPTDRRRDRGPLGVVERIVRRSLPRSRGKAATIQRYEFRKRLRLRSRLDPFAVAPLEVMATGTAHGGKRRPPLLDECRIGFECRCRRRLRLTEQAGDDVPAVLILERQGRHAA